MKKRTIFALIMSAMILTACGSAKDMASESFTNGAAYDQNSKSESYNYVADEGTYDDYESEAVEVTPTATGSVDSSNQNNNTVYAADIQRDMLIYSCNMSVDVLEFDKAIENYRLIMDKYEAFIGDETFNDGGSTSRWYDSSAQRWKSYNATVRVPSGSYDDFCAEISELGDLRNKKATVENVSTEYNDLSTTLKIYEEKEKRYLEMLSEVKDEAQMVVIEEYLTNVQIEIARIRTRMNRIKTDVAYSYVNISINEVKEYTEQPVRTDTFGQRFVKTLKDTGIGFLRFLEGALFFIIAVLPYALLIGAAVLVFSKIVKAIKKSRAEKRSKKTTSEKLQAETKPDGKETDKK